MTYSKLQKPLNSRDKFIIIKRLSKNKTKTKER